MGVQYSFCKSVFGAIAVVPITCHKKAASDRDSHLNFWYPIGRPTVCAPFWEEMAASGMNLWFTGAEYIPRCVTEYTRLNINSSDCWSRGEKLLQVCPADEQFKLQDLRRFQVKIFKATCCVCNSRQRSGPHTHFFFFNPPVNGKQLSFFFFTFGFVHHETKS